MATKFFGEFMGTLVLVLLGDGVVANVLLKRSKAEGAGWMVIASGWAFAVMAVLTQAVLGGRYLNFGDALFCGDDRRRHPDDANALQSELDTL